MRERERERERERQRESETEIAGKKVSRGGGGKRAGGRDGEVFSRGSLGATQQHQAGRDK